jgi:hypothetical protein
LFDSSGALIGVATDTGTRSPRRIPIGALFAALGRDALPLGSTAGRLGADEVYERALRCVVQVLVRR